MSLFNCRVNVDRKPACFVVVGDLIIDEHHTNELVQVSEVVRIQGKDYILLETNRGGRLFTSGSEVSVVEFPKVPYDPEETY